MARKKNTSPDMFGAGTGQQQDLLRVNLAAPAELLHERRGTRRRIVVWTVVVAVGLGSLVTVNNILNPVVPKVVASNVSSIDVNSSLGKSVAIEQITTWLAQDPSPLPGGYIVSWDGFTTIKGGTPKSESDHPADPAELHRFTIASNTDKGAVFYDAIVLVSVDKHRGAIAVTPPTLLPRVPASTQGWSSQLWPGWEVTTTGEALNETATAWAQAFVGTPAALRLYVGDESESHSYMPLAGARIAGTQVLQAAYKGEKTDKPKTVIARVELTIAWGGAAGINGNKGTKTSYDVLVEGANTASPKVVAWGPAGTGPKLERFGNAVDGTALGSEQGVPSAPPSASPDDTKSTDAPMDTTNDGSEG